MSSAWRMPLDGPSMYDFSRLGVGFMRDSFLAQISDDLLDNRYRCPNSFVNGRRRPPRAAAPDDRRGLRAGPAGADARRRGAPRGPLVPRARSRPDAAQ